MAKNKRLKAYNLDQVIAKLMGKIGTPKRDRFEEKLKNDLMNRKKHE